MHQVVVAQLAAARQGTHKTKTRGEVSGGGKKPYRQKGTGRARQGSTRAPQFNGGGVVHGPVPARLRPAHPEEDEGRRAARCPVGPGPRRQRARAVQPGRRDTPSTKTARAALAAVAALSSAKNILVVLSHDDVTGWKSLRNVPEVHLLTCRSAQHLRRAGQRRRGLHPRRPWTSSSPTRARRPRSPRRSRHRPSPPPRRPRPRPPRRPAVTPPPTRAAGDAALTTRRRRSTSADR